MEYVKAVYCHPDYLTYMLEYIMRNAGLEEAQARIKTVYNSQDMEAT